MKQWLITGLVVTWVAAGSAQTGAEQYGQQIKPERIREHLTILASTEFQGRETAMEGQRKAAAYIEQQFKEFGLQPYAGNKYQQPFQVLASSLGGEMKFSDKTYGFLDNFYYYMAFVDTVINPELVFVAKGTRTELEAGRLNGRAALICDSDFGKYKGGASDWKMRARNAEKAGASAVFVITPEFEEKKQILDYYLSFSSMRLPGGEEQDYEKKKAPKIPYIFISEEIGRALLVNAGIEPTKLHKVLVGTSLGKPITLNIQGADKRLESTNVIGVIPGTDLKNEYLIITAHYDHLGTRGDLTFHGADDDGSGTSALLTMAEVFAKAAREGNGPRRTLVFMAVSGEEKGLLGSEFYVNNPVFPLEQTVSNLNVDMIGRIDPEHKPDTNYVYLIGSDRLSTDLHDISEQANNTYTKLTLDYTYNDPADPNQFYYRSDHYNFASHGIPVIFYFSGVHEDYHQPTDTFDKIMYGKTAVITRLIFYTAWDLLNRDLRPVVNVKD
jgi:hypothetical protein